MVQTVACAEIQTIQKYMEFPQVPFLDKLLPARVVQDKRLIQTAQKTGVSTGCSSWTRCCLPVGAHARGYGVQFRCGADRGVMPQIIEEIGKAIQLARCGMIVAVCHRLWRNRGGDPTCVSHLGWFLTSCSDVRKRGGADARSRTLRCQAT